MPWSFSKPTNACLNILASRGLHNDMGSCGPMLLITGMMTPTIMEHSTVGGGPASFPWGTPTLWHGTSKNLSGRTRLSQGFGGKSRKGPRPRCPFGTGLVPSILNQTHQHAEGATRFEVTSSKRSSYWVVWRATRSRLISRTPSKCKAAAWPTKRETGHPPLGCRSGKARRQLRYRLKRSESS